MNITQMEEKIEAVRGLRGERLYNEDQTNRIFQKEARKRVSYARASSEHHRDGVERQKQVPGQPYSE
jgi:predicted site-specific integrase-resolvase